MEKDFYAQDYVLLFYSDLWPLELQVVGIASH
jgi:hypothetical protein